MLRAQLQHCLADAPALQARSRAGSPVKTLCAAHNISTASIITRPRKSQCPTGPLPLFQFLLPHSSSRPSRFSEEQIIDIARGRGRRLADGLSLPRVVGRHSLHLLLLFRAELQLCHSTFLGSGHTNQRSTSRSRSSFDNRSTSG